MHDLRRSVSRFVTTCAVLMLGYVTPTTATAQIVFQDNLPCSSRRDFTSCFAECIDSPDPTLGGCFCLYDERVDASKPCPEGQTCCFNMPCARWDQQGSLQCLRGGGSLDALTPRNCDYHPDGQGGGLCECTPPLVKSTYDYADFTVLNTIDFLLPPFDCVCPFTTDEQWLRLGVCNPPGVSKLAIKLNFQKPSMDSIGLSGTLAVPDGFSRGGATLEVSIGGIVKSFTLDAKGKAKVGTDQAQLSVKKKKGVVLAQDARLALRLAKGSFASSLVDDGLANATVKDVAVTVPVEIKLNGTMYAKAQSQTYTAKQGKTGRTK